MDKISFKYNVLNVFYVLTNEYLRLNNSQEPKVHAVLVENGQSVTLNVWIFGKFHI